jgi:hypothetical protein
MALRIRLNAASVMALSLAVASSVRADGKPGRPAAEGVKVSGRVFGNVVEEKGGKPVKKPAAGAAVHLRDLPRDWDAGPSAEPVTLRLVKGRLVPELACLQVGQKLVVKAAKGEMFDLHAHSREREEYGQIVPSNPRVFTDSFPKPDDYVSLACAINPRARAHLQVVPTPGFTLCDAEGRFTLPRRLPAGRHVLRGFLPGLGWGEKAITLRGDEGEVRVDIELAPRQAWAKAAVEKCKAALVVIRAPQREGEAKGDGRPGPALGILLDAKGTVVTSHSLIKGMEKLEVVLGDGRRLPARTVRSDRDLDLAMLCVEDSKPLPHARVGDSDKVAVGDRVLALSAPWRIATEELPTVTRGIIAGKARTARKGETLFGVDTAIGPGCGPGPLINTEGEFIGLVVGRELAPRGTNGAVPSKRILERLAEWRKEK